ncbi:MAG TPA: chemotaxis protein CheW [Geopsychrobacteraceae bacterium]|nr:chemotaxis protein CheW [Geopsychrobacteraceae bacterium]
MDSDAGFVGATEEEYAQDLQAHDIDSEGGAVQWLTFFLNDEEYALGLSDVVELVRPRHLTELPQVPDYLLGIVSLRGVIVPVIDLSLRLKLPCSDDVSQQRIIVCAMGDQQIGLQVDRVAQVVKVRRDQVEPPPMVLDANAGDFVAGVGRINGRMLVLLDPEKVMDICPLETLPV